MRINSAVPRTLAALGCAGLLVGLPAVAIADPGSPGVNSAQNGNYRGPTGPTVLGEQPDTAPGTKGDQGVQGESPVITPASDSAPVQDEGGGVRSLPFTGLAIGGVLAAGLTLLLLGGGLRRLVPGTSRS
jgi:hypothetical protein